MHNLPESRELLLAARKTLLDEIRPMLDESAKYTIAMIANAMAIAAREAEVGETPALAALARLDRIYGVQQRDLHGHALRQALADQERQLADDIRIGEFDASGESRRAVLDHLRKAVIARLQVSNPKSLP
jgi:hypothetical protein